MKRAVEFRPFGLGFGLALGLGNCFGRGREWF